MIKTTIQRKHYPNVSSSLREKKNGYANVAGAKISTSRKGNYRQVTLFTIINSNIRF